MTENITVFKHSSIGIKAEVGMIYVDPFEIEGEPHDAAFILITHDHYDHFSTKDIAKVAGIGTVLVVPRKMVEKAREVESLVGKIETVKPGIVREIDGLTIETVPMYNILKPFHPRNAEWVGYVIVDGGVRIYVAGDIDAIKEAKTVKCDVALVPVGGFYTMDAKKAADLVNAMKPSVAIPVHYGSIVGTPRDGSEFAKYVKDPVKAEIKIK